MEETKSINLGENLKEFNWLKKILSYFLENKLVEVSSSQTYHSKAELLIKTLQPIEKTSIEDADVTFSIASFEYPQVLTEDYKLGFYNRFSNFYAIVNDLISNENVESGSFRQVSPPIEAYEIVGMYNERLDVNQHQLDYNKYNQ